MLHLNNQNSMPVPAKELKGKVKIEARNYPKYPILTNLSTPLKLNNVIQRKMSVTLKVKSEEQTKRQQEIWIKVGNHHPINSLLNALLQYFAYFFLDLQ